MRTTEPFESDRSCAFHPRQGDIEHGRSFCLTLVEPIATVYAAQPLTRFESAIIQPRQCPVKQLPQLVPEIIESSGWVRPPQPVARHVRQQDGQVVESPVEPGALKVELAGDSITELLSTTLVDALVAIAAGFSGPSAYDAISRFHASLFGTQGPDVGAS